MRALDAAEGPVERFACELRELRVAAGEPAFWKMARRCDVSKSALAAAVAGYQLPSERVARAFVLVCGGHWPWWSVRLAQARAGLGPVADAPAVGGSQHTGAAAALVPVRRMPLVRAGTRGELTVRAGSPSSLPARPAGYGATGSQRWVRRYRVHGRRRMIVLMAAALAVLAAVVMAVPLYGAPRAAPRSSPRSTPPSTPLGLPATVATAIRASGTPREARATPLSSPRSTPPFSPLSRSTPPSSPPGLPAAIDLVRVVSNAGADSHVTAQPLSLTASQLGQLNATPRGDPAYQAWFTARGAVDLDKTAVQIIVEGNRGHPVRIVDLQPVATCFAPLTGTLFMSPSSGVDGSTRLFVDLDSPRRTLQYSTWDNGVETTGQDFFGTYTVSLAQGEQQVFELVASSEKHYCTFTLNMTVVDGGQTVVEHISDDGRPFAVSAFAPQRTAAFYSAYSVLYIGGVLSPTQAWVREDPNTYGQ